MAISTCLNRCTARVTDNLCIAIMYWKCITIFSAGRIFYLIETLNRTNTMIFEYFQMQMISFKKCIRYINIGIRYKCQNIELYKLQKGTFLKREFVVYVNVRRCFVTQSSKLIIQSITSLLFRDMQIYARKQ